MAASLQVLLRARNLERTFSLISDAFVPAAVWKWGPSVTVRRRSSFLVASRDVTNRKNESTPSPLPPSVEIIVSTLESIQGR